jgi:hypothetical protein
VRSQPGLWKSGLQLKKTSSIDCEFTGIAFIKTKGRFLFPWKKEFYLHGRLRAIRKKGFCVSSLPPVVFGTLAIGVIAGLLIKIPKRKKN